MINNKQVLERTEPEHRAGPPEKSGDVTVLKAVRKGALFEPLPDGRFPTLQEFKRQYVEKVLAHVNHNRAKAAEVLGIDRTSLWRKLKNYNLKPLPSDQRKGGCNEAKKEERT